VIALSACSGTSLEDGCELIEKTVDETVIRVARVAHSDNTTATGFATAADEVATLSPGLEEANLPEELEEAQEQLADHMHELVHALDEEKTDWAVAVASDMQRIEVNLGSVCNNL